MLIQRRLLLRVALLLAVAPGVRANQAEAGAAEAPQTILVAGATGNIGRFVVADLLARGHRVRGLTRAPGKASERVPQAEWVGGDLRDRASLVPAVDGVDAIVFVAGARSWSDPSNSAKKIYFEGVEHLAQLGHAAGARRMVLVSSAGTERGWPGASDHLRDVLRWKARGETSLRASGMEFAILRPLGMDDGPGGKFGIALTQGDAVRSRVSISRADLAAVTVEAVFSPHARNASFELFNATSSPGAWRRDLELLRPDPTPATSPDANAADRDPAPTDPDR